MSSQGSSKGVPERPTRSSKKGRGSLENNNTIDKYFSPADKSDKYDHEPVHHSTPEEAAGDGPSAPAENVENISEEDCQIVAIGSKPIPVLMHERVVNLRSTRGPYRGSKPQRLEVLGSAAGSVNHSKKQDPVLKVAVKVTSRGDGNVRMPLAACESPIPRGEQHTSNYIPTPPAASPVKSDVSETASKRSFKRLRSSDSCSTSSSDSNYPKTALVRVVSLDKICEKGFLEEDENAPESANVSTDDTAASSLPETSLGIALLPIPPGSAEPTTSANATFVNSVRAGNSSVEDPQPNSVSVDLDLGSPEVQVVRVENSSVEDPQPGTSSASVDLDLGSPEVQVVRVENASADDPQPGTSSASVVLRSTVENTSVISFNYGPEESSEGESSGNSSDDSEVYEVEEVLDYNNSDRYLVKWKGYDDKDNTWEPLANLSGCHKELVKFYLKRKREHENDAVDNPSKRRKTRKVPPDPRTVSELVEAYFQQENTVRPSDEELNVSYQALKTANMNGLWSAEKLKKSLEKVLSGVLSFNDVTGLKQQVEYHMSLEVETKLKAVMGKWERHLNKRSKECPKIYTENNVDLIFPPREFHYTSTYIPRHGIKIPDDPPTGCECSGNCAVTNNCCPQQLGSHKSTYYSAKGLLKVPVGTPIYECNKKCPCDKSCPNRVVQDGVSPLKGKSFCIFRTSDGRGWGVKTLQAIPKNSFVCLYTGEIITAEEADKRGRKYDDQGSTYLFDLDFCETENDEDECPYTVDAYTYGNISHFINHSCAPNLAVYGVWHNCLDINLPMLALFSIEKIAKGAELTFDYRRSETHDGNRTRMEQDGPLIKKLVCKCGAKNCRKSIF